MTAPTTSRPRLTKREREILLLVADGGTEPEIAAELGVRPVTVTFHIRNLRDKLGARNRTHAVAVAYQRGLLMVSVPGGQTVQSFAARDRAVPSTEFTVIGGVA